jgi:hypothetical protein
MAADEHGGSIMTDRKIVTALALALMVALSAGAAHALHPDEERVQEARETISQWKPAAHKAAEQMLDAYGEPDEITSERLIWHDNGPWQRTEVVNEEIDHNFPMPHKDMLYQTINYSVPSHKVEDLAQFTGSIIVDRVKGELTARCDQEEANFLSLNLAHRIVQDELTAQEARDIYAEAMREGEHAELKQGLAFEVPEDPQADPGEEHQVAGG